MRRLALFGSLALSLGTIACGSDNGTADSPLPDAPIVITPDAPAPDVRLPDARLPDAATFSGTIAVHDVALLNPPGGAGAGMVNAAAGTGAQITINFSKDGAPTVESHSMNGSFAGQTVPCGASYSNVADLNPDIDEGAVSFTIKHMNNSDGTPVPNCTFQNGSYSCVALASATGGTFAVASGSSSFLTFTDGGSNTFAATNIGRYFIDTGTGKAFPITGADGSNKLAVVNLPAVGPGAVASYVIAAGVGPVPATTDVNGNVTGAAPTFFADGDKVVIGLVGGAQVPAYTSASIAVGGAVTLDAATETLLASNLDVSGAHDTTFTITGAGASALQVAVVTIDASNATNAGANDLGTNGTLTGNLTCAAAAIGSIPAVVVPASVMKVIGDMHPTKLRVSVFRDGSDLGKPGNLNVVAGHGLVQFQTPP